MGRRHRLRSGRLWRTSFTRLGPSRRDIPILGNLFKATDNSSSRTELLVLIQPRVVRNSEDARAVTEELRRKLPAIFPPEPKEEGVLPEIGTVEGGLPSS